jgi:hypothetical protein
MWDLPNHLLKLHETAIIAEIAWHVYDAIQLPLDFLNDDDLNLFFNAFLHEHAHSNEETYRSSALRAIHRLYRDRWTDVIPADNSFWTDLGHWIPCDAPFDYVQFETIDGDE